MPRLPPQSARPGAVALVALLACLPACDEASSAVSAGPEGGAAVAEIEAGTRALSAGRVLEAEAHLRRAVERAPRDADAHFHLGRALYAQTLVTLGGHHVSTEKAHAAAACFDAAIELEPNVAHHRVQRGLVALRLQDFPRAERELRRAVELAPDLATARAQLGVEMEDAKLIIGTERAAVCPHCGKPV